MNAVVYCRVSSKEQVEGTSLESQEIACREYASQNQLNVVAVFIERGESAKFADRTQLLELLAFCQQRENSVQALLVWKIDRLARNVGDHFNIKATLLKQNIRVVSVTEPIGSNPEGKLLETILAGFAQFDNDLRATRTLHGMRRKLLEGIFPWKAPFGYRSVSSAGGKKTEPDQPEQPGFAILRRIWAEFSTGAYTKAEILRLAAVWGLRTAAGLPLSAQTLDHMFENPFYAGILRDPWSGQQHEGKHIPLVSREMFITVQALSRRRPVVHRKRVRAEFPLRGFARCSGCRHAFTGALSRGRSKMYPYYRCSNHKCDHTESFSTGVVHDEFETYLTLIAPNHLAISRLSEAIREGIHTRRESKERLAQKNEMQLKRCQEQQRRLIQMKMNDQITDEEFLTERSLLSERMLSLEATLIPANLPKEREFRSALDELRQPLMELPLTWAKIPPDLKQRFQQSILPVGFVHGSIETAQMGRFFSALTASAAGNTNGVPPAGGSWNHILADIQAFALVLRCVGES